MEKMNDWGAWIRMAALFTLWIVVRKLIQWFFSVGAPNPFANDDKKPRKPYVTDQKLRDSVIKQGFSVNKVPDNLDAIVIGSGIGGLSTAALLSKVGKKVLVLEQHDQAGGCCHTFIDKGYEFDVGIHYIGDCGYPTFTKVLFDQISEGQLEWAPLDDTFDEVSIGYGQDNRMYPICDNGKDGKWKAILKKSFPGEEKAIDEYFKLLKKERGTPLARVLVKMLPLWLAKLIIATGIINLITNLWKKPLVKSTKEVIESLTSNKDLQTIFCYNWGDYGTPPANSPFSMQALLINHYMRGGYYPVGGASEIAHSVIPVIERSGGKVLVRVKVEQIIVENGKAVGVQAKKGTEVYTLRAPIIISDAGLYNTFQSLLPVTVAKKSYYTSICQELKPAVASIGVFVGFNKSNEELGLKKRNYWAFAKPALDGFDNYLNLSKDECMDKDLPLMFISFPSTKDPNWKNHHGRENKSTMAVVSFANWDWYKEFQNAPLKKRGDEYDELKNAVGYKMIDRCCELFPQIKDHIDFVDIGSPVTNKYYIEQPHGEIYGLDHTVERMDAMNTAKLRPKTDIPGLFLTGQDIFSCGFAGATIGGMLAAAQILDRNLAKDLQALQAKVIQSEKKKM